MKKLLAGAALAGALVLSASPAFATKPDDHKVTICHATSSPSNPYVRINVDIASSGYLKAGHSDHAGDIIPPYDYGTFHYPGKGDQAILANECEPPETPTTTVPPTPSTTVPPTPSTTVPPTPTTTLPELPPVEHPCVEDGQAGCPTRPDPPAPTEPPAAQPPSVHKAPPELATTGWETHLLVLGLVLTASGFAALAVGKRR